MASNFLRVAEQFYSIQGEGVTIGVPAVFLRLSGCNLLCSSDDWVCDSIDVWTKGTKTAFEDVFSEEDIRRFHQGVHLVITGGEPMMHQKQVIRFLKWFLEQYHFLPTIEVETNGTYTPDRFMIRVVSHWNVSPKLRNSGEEFVKRFKKDSLIELWNLPTSIFKFVISSPSDISEINYDYGEFITWGPKTVLMPAGDSIVKLRENEQQVVMLAKQLRSRYSTRLHIHIWDKATGV